MKASIWGLSGISIGKVNFKDSRLDAVDAITKAKKKTYIQIELVNQESVFDADAILAGTSVRADVVLQDLDFIDNRLQKAQDQGEKTLLQKCKAALEKELLLNQVSLTEEEAKLMAGYSVLSKRPVVVVSDDATLTPEIVGSLLKESGYASFFTTGEKETRAWLIKNKTSAWEAAGVIHSDIQQGFIRAEIISFDDFIACGGETKAKQAGKLRLEQKDYCMNDCDVVMFRFNK